MAADNHIEHARRYLADSAEIKRRTAESCAPDIVTAASIVSSVLRSGGKLLICGNGGSAADSQHIAAEFVSTLTKDFDRPSLPAIALTTDTSILTAYANDFGYDGVFERQVEGLGKPGDALLGLSTSGNSRNVILAMRAASKLDMQTIAFVGANNGAIGDIARVVVKVPTTETGHVQEAHIAIAHVFCFLVEEMLYPGRRKNR